MQNTAANFSFNEVNQIKQVYEKGEFDPIKTYFFSAAT
jgi:hypothetical protein